MSALAAARAIHFTFSIQAIGAILILLIAEWRPDAVATRRRLMMIIVIAALMVPPSGLAWMTLQAADITDRGAVEAWTGGAVATLLWHSQAGLVWWVRFALAGTLAIATALLACRRQPEARGLMSLVFVIAVLQFVSAAWLSHAASTPGPYRSLHLAVHSAHMLGASLWFGGLLPLAMLLSRAQRDGTAANFALARDVAVRFSAIALTAVCIIILTGVTNMAMLVGGDIADAINGPFAKLLAIKLVLFMAILIFAAANRQLLLPRLAGANVAWAITLLKCSVWIELALAAAILVAVGELGITPPDAEQ
jgi:putative copper resistance protein D